MQTSFYCCNSRGCRSFECNQWDIFLIVLKDVAFKMIFSSLQTLIKLTKNLKIYLVLCPQKIWIMMNLLILMTMSTHSSLQSTLWGRLDKNGRSECLAEMVGEHCSSESVKHWATEPTIGGRKALRFMDQVQRLANAIGHPESHHTICKTCVYNVWASRYKMFF